MSSDDNYCRMSPIDMLDSAVEDRLATLRGRGLCRPPEERDE